MIRIEVTTEADVTRMVAAFTVLPVLRDSDYEVWLTPVLWPHDSAGKLRGWRKDGQRGGTGSVNVIHHGPGATGGFDGMGGAGGGGSHGDVVVRVHNPEDTQ